MLKCYLTSWEARPSFNESLWPQDKITLVRRGGRKHHSLHLPYQISVELYCVHVSSAAGSLHCVPLEIHISTYRSLLCHALCDYFLFCTNIFSTFHDNLTVKFTSINEKMSHRWSECRGMSETLFFISSKFLVCTLVFFLINIFWLTVGERNCSINTIIISIWIERRLISVLIGNIFCLLFF